MQDRIAAQLERKILILLMLERWGLNFYGTSLSTARLNSGQQMQIIAYYKSRST